MLKEENPFAYLTQICYHAFLRRIHREKKHLYIKNKCVIQSAVMNELYITGELDTVAASNPVVLDFANDNTIAILRLISADQLTLYSHRRKLT